jgi:hypothetical protein
MKTSPDLTPILSAALIGVVVLDVLSFALLHNALGSTQYVAFTALFFVLGISMLHTQPAPASPPLPVKTEEASKQQVPQVVPDPMGGPYHAVVQPAEGQTTLYVLTGLAGQDAAHTLEHEMHYQALLHQTLQHIRQTGREARVIHSETNADYQPIFDRQLSQVTADLLQVPSHVINYN